MTSSYLGTAVTTGRLAAVFFSLAVAAVSSQGESPTRVRVNGVELHYIERGQGEPLILLHGGQGDYRAWPLQIEALSPRYRVISYSRRYHYPNKNPLTASNHSALIDAADLAGLIAELRLGPVHLVGTSYGAFTALALAVEHPELVRSLVLAEPPIHRWVTHTARGGELFKQFMTGVQEPAAKAFAAGNDEAAMRIFIDAFDGVGTFAALPAERRTVILQNTGFFKAATSSSDPFPNLPKKRVRRLRMPILIVRGDGTDELHRLVTEELGRVVPDAERVTIPQAGHGSPRQNPRAFNAAMLDFLDRGSAQTPAPSVNGLVSAAKNAAGLEWPGTFMRLCVPPPPAAGRGAAPNAAPPGPPAKSSWYAEPAKVADNLYFIGTKIHNAWALVGGDGIIVFEALFDYAAPDEIAEGMRKLGLDVNKVKYVVLSHAHADHDGGARFLQDKLPTAHLVYGGPDWDAVDKSTNRAGGKPKRDTVGTDGLKLSVGDASVQIVTTPGHTAGTLSFLFEVKDNGKPLRVAYVGGTAIPFDGSAEYYDTYIASVKKMAKAAADFGATVLLSNHTEFDNGYYKAHTAAHRQPGEANPFDVGRIAVDRYFTVVEDCATAAKLRASGGR